MKLTKLLLKIVTPSSDSTWEHLCYVEEDLYKKFLKDLKCERKEFVDYLIPWIKADFNLDLTMSKKSDILILRSLIKDRARKIYPSLCMPDTPVIDRQGWTRVWVTEQMKKELEKHGFKYEPKP